MIDSPQLIDMLSKKTSLPIETIENLFSSLTEIAFQHRHEGVSLPGFGQIIVEEGAPYLIQNPATDEVIEMDGKLDIRLKPDTTAREKFLAEKDESPQLDSPIPFVRRVLPELNLSLDPAQCEQLEIPNSESRTKLGGTPYWIQDEEEPTCCGTNMTFFGQFDSSIGGPFRIGDAGMIYVFACDHCPETVSFSQSF